ncbi:MAG: lipoate--protein ligase family protein [Ignavibacteriales bacterium]|nr:lipoate--protein ligase family protein [Ignavibacteriales bacterium]
MIWRFLNTGFNTGKFNMQLDEQLARSFDFNSDIPIFRVYGWKPYTISLGFNQSESDFNISKILADGLEIVRRPTGGRAIFHAHELTYSVIMCLGDQRPRDIYHSINNALMRGLRMMKIDAQLSPESENFRIHYQTVNSIPCFSSSAKYEIQYQGKKIIGSAQRRFGKIILQHGSFLLGIEHRQLSSYLIDHAAGKINDAEESFTAKTIEAETILNRKVSFEESVEYIKEGFQEEFDITWENFGSESIPKLNDGKVALYEKD